MSLLTLRRRPRRTSRPGVTEVLAGMRVKRETTVRELAADGLNGDDVIAVYLRDSGAVICRDHVLEPTALHTIAAIGSPDLVVVLLTGTPTAQRLLRRRCLRCGLDHNPGVVP